MPVTECSDCGGEEGVAAYGHHANPHDCIAELSRRLAAETSDHNATKVKCEVYGRTCQHIGEVIGWDRSQQRLNESLWDAMARCVVRYGNRRGQTINSGR